MALNLININSSGLPTCRTSTDGSIDISGIASGKFGIKALPVARNATGTDSTVRVNASTSYGIPISATTAKAYSGMPLGFTINSVAAGAFVCPYDGLYRLAMGIGIGADLPSTSYDTNSTYSGEIRTNSANIHLSQQIDMTGVLPGSGGNSSAGAFRYEELYKVLTAGTLLFGLMKLYAGTGGHYHAYSSITVEYCGPATQTI